MRSFDNEQVGQALRSSRLIDNRPCVLACLAILSKDFGCRFLAGTAGGGDAERGLQAPKVFHTGLCGLADLLVSNGVADADVHNFNNLEA